MTASEHQSTSHPPKRRWYQYSLRAFLIFVLLAGAGLGLLTPILNHARQQRISVQAITASGGVVRYDDELGHTPVPEPGLIQRALGKDLSSEVALAALEGPAITDAKLQPLSSLTGLQSTQVWNASESCPSSENCISPELGLPTVGWPISRA